MLCRKKNPGWLKFALRKYLFCAYLYQDIVQLFRMARQLYHIQELKIVPAKEDVDVDVAVSTACSSKLLLWLEVSMSSPRALCPPSVFILELCDMELSMEHRDSWSSETSRRKLDECGRMWLDRSRYGTSWNTEENLPSAVTEIKQSKISQACYALCKY